MTAAETLRKAAALMRDRALGTDRSVGGAAHWFDASTFRQDGHADYDAAHIASWTPTVALLVAAWLDAESNEPEVEVGAGITTGGPSLMALAVAYAYLGDPA